MFYPTAQEPWLFKMIMYQRLFLKGLELLDLLLFHPLLQVFSTMLLNNECGACMYLVLSEVHTFKVWLGFGSGSKTRVELLAL